VFGDFQIDSIVDQNITNQNTCSECGCLLPSPTNLAKSPTTKPNTYDQILNKFNDLESLLIRNQSPWRTINEAADYIGVSRRTVQRYIKDGTLQAHVAPSGMIRINQNNLDGWVMFGRPYRKLTRPQKEQLSELCR